jgi:hypothetical protein
MLIRGGGGGGGGERSQASHAWSRGMQEAEELVLFSHIMQRHEAAIK